MEVTGRLAELGPEAADATADRATMTVALGPQTREPQGVVPGGMYCTMVQTLANLGATTWLGDRGDVVAVSNHTEFLRACRSGNLHGVASPIHRGRTQQLWLVEITDDDGRAVARGQVRLANIASTEHLGA